jgi:DNA polymerase-3 subunit beta
MKFTIEKQNLISLLSKTQNIVEKRNTMPILVNVLLEATGDELKVFATDLEVSLTDQAICQISEGGKVAVDAKNLFNLVKELNEGPIQITKKPNHWIELKQNRSVFNIVGLPAEEYPLFPIYSTDNFLNVSSKMLLDMIEKTIYSVSTDETRYHLNGVYFERGITGSENRYRMVATDGHRLCLVDRQIENNKTSEVTAGVIVPRKGLHEVRKILESNRDGQVQVAIEGAQLIVKNASTLLMVRLIEGRYPNYQQLIPQNLKKKIYVSRSYLVSSLRRVSRLSNQKSKGVTFSFSKGTLQISSTNPELGDAKEELEVQYDGEEIKIGFNARYLLDALASFEDDNVEINLNDQVSPIVLRPKNDSDYTCIIMPMRI